MALHMHTTKLLALTCVMEGIQAKTYDGRLPENLPTPRQMLDVTQKLLLNYKKNFVEPDINPETRKWSTPPAGVKNLRNYNILLPLAEFASAHLKDIQLQKYDIPMVIQSYNTDLDHIDTHLIPVLDENHKLSDYPDEVQDWLGNRAQFIFGPCLGELRKAGVISAPNLADITLSEWEELSNAEYMTLGEQVDTMTSSKDALIGTDGASFPEEGKPEVPENMDELTSMSMGTITEEMLADVGGDEHISLYQENYDGTHYLSDDDNVARALEATKILKGYWDLLDLHHSKKSADLRQKFIMGISGESKKYWAERQEANKHAGISVIV